MVAYNVANLKSKLSFCNFFAYINNFDIFFLFETNVVCDKKIEFVHFFDNYVLYWEDAVKFHNSGRASGGSLFGFKKCIQNKYNLRFNVLSGNVTLSAKFGDKSLHFIPRYLNCTRWVGDFEKFEQFLYGMKFESFCIVGDLNARTGAGQLIDGHLLQGLPYISQERNSKDRITDAKGKKCLELFENVGGVILNGRMLGDECGELTFCGAMGSSIIDYCICSFDFLGMVNSFVVQGKPYSDHMPLSLSFSPPLPKTTEIRPLTLDKKLKWIPSMAVKYSETLCHLSNYSYIHSNVSIEDKVKTLTNKIKTAVGTDRSKKKFIPKQKWFDFQCLRARNKMLKLLRLFRKHNLNLYKDRYNHCRSQYINICKRKKLMQSHENISKLNSVRNSEEWWRLTNNLKSASRKNRSTLQINDFYNHFKTLLSQTECESNVLWCLPLVRDTFLDRPFEMWELLHVLQKSKNNKAPGKDRISYEFYKNAPECFLEEVMILLNRIFLTGDVPDSFRSSIIIPLFKKGDPNDCVNYRGLSLLDTLYKMFTGLILNRINGWIETNDILCEYQSGFRAGYSTIDSIFNLTSIIHLNRKKKNNTYAFFVDFSCAFDLIPRNSLFFKLASFGLSSKIIETLQSLYRNTTCQVWDGFSLSDSFEVYAGVKQGCLLSPTLFSLYLNDLHSHLPGGVSIADTVVKVLLYADDLVVLSESPTELQFMINSLFNYCSLWGLKINLNKSKIVVFRAGSRISNSLNWKYGTEHIQIVNDYKYLGVNLTYNLSFTRHLDSKLSVSKCAINSTWAKYIHHPNINFTNKLKIFDTAARSIMLYGAQVWGSKSYEQVEKLFRFFMKKMLNLPINTPNYMLYLETGLKTQYLRTLYLHFEYINKVLEYPEGRLPRILARETLDKKTFWVLDWENLCCKLNIDIDLSNISFRSPHKNILLALDTQEHDNHISDARRSQFHDIYPDLNYDIMPYFVNENTPHLVSLIFKARCGLLNINARAFKKDTFGICTVCNFDEAENTYHLIGRCPIYKKTRLLYFGKEILSIEEVHAQLNGNNFTSLYKFLVDSIKYRKLIVTEFA